MCLTIPGRIQEIEVSNPAARTATVDFAGILKKVNLVYLPEARVGDYVLVHAGFATDTLSEAEALESLRYASEMSEQMVKAPSLQPAEAAGQQRDRLARKGSAEVTP